MIEQSVIQSIVQAHIEQHNPDLYIVEVSIHPGNRILVEIGADQGVSIDECVALSKHIESQLDREEEDFELEVGSAGITSAFKVLRQYIGAIGSEVELLRKGGIKERGLLRSANESGVELEVERKIKPEGAKRKQLVLEVIQIPVDEVLQTKRIIKI